MRNKIIILVLMFFYSYFFAEKVTLSNNYITITIDKESGRFTLQTLEGDPMSPLDNNKNLLYSKIPPTSFTAIYIDGETVIYGHPKGSWLRKPYLSENKIISAWQYRNLSILQEIKIIKNPSTGFEDNMLINTTIVNRGGKVTVGLAYVFDILLDNKEASFFNITRKGIFSNELQVSGDDIPISWNTYDSIDNPTIKVQGIVHNYGAIKPDRVVFATWDRLSELWRLSPNNSYDFRRRGTTQFDGAVGIFYDPKDLYKNDTLEGATIYGVMGGNILTEEDIILTLNIPKEPKELPIPITAMLINKSQNEIENLSLEITLPEGFYLTEGEKIVETKKVQPNGIFQTSWFMSTDSAGGNFYVKVMATISQQNEKKIIESEEGFFANFVKQKKPKTPKQEKVVSKTDVLLESKEISPPKNKKEKSKLKRIDELIEEVDHFYDNWIEIYYSVFNEKNYSLEDINKAIKEIDKEIEYLNNSISNITKEP
ncbi:MAG: hypothetical protein N2258_05560 [Brevinematales bacterium]|nr:hypothetical protein [Brevinematales bacterium]